MGLLVETEGVRQAAVGLCYKSENTIKAVIYKWRSIFYLNSNLLGKGVPQNVRIFLTEVFSDGKNCFSIWVKQ